MAAFSWQIRPTVHFGQVWVPILPISLQAIDGSFQTIALQYDTGAVVSLLRCSIATLLGIDRLSGRPIELTSVGGASTAAHVHHIMTKFEGLAPQAVPYAIADNENVPNLLGRLGIFDTLHVAFDPSRRETVITP